MSDVLDRFAVAPTSTTTARPTLASPAGSSPRAGIRLTPAAATWARGALAAVWSVSVGLASLTVLALVVWAADSQSNASAGAAVRFAAQIWLLAQRTPLHTHGGTVTIPPLALTAAIGVLLARGAALATRHNPNRDQRTVVTIALSVAVPYAILTGVVAAVSSSSTFAPSAGAATVCGFLVAMIAALVGSAREATVIGPIWRTLPEAVRAAAEAAGAAAAVYLGGATVLVTASLALHAHRFGSITGAFGSGSGKVAVLLLSLFYLPNAILFAAAYLAGPGFALGAGTSVGVGGVHVASLPTLPLLAGVPGAEADWLVMAVAAAAILGAGLAAGWRVEARIGAAAESRLVDQVRCALLSAALLGLATAVVAAIAGGPSGPGRLRAVGPSPWRLGLSVAGEVGALAVLAVLVFAWTGSTRVWPRLFGRGVSEHNRGG
ncbi:MAG TPA: DUF6350 family protein [Mycobacteriales bacterium]|nr:DUF6350 family protein [Mycobacteriales bacterium]